jgi:ribosomal protein S18 acetylase RimI-like enzyme
MDQDPFKNQEREDIRIKMATPDDWKIYKELSLEVLSGQDAEMFRVGGADFLPNQIARSDASWREALSGQDLFVFLAYVDTSPAGMGTARKSRVEEGVWYNGFAYTRSEFRKRGLGRKIILERLREIKRRGGEKIRTFIEAGNKDSISNVESFGFKRVDPEKSSHDDPAIQARILQHGLIALELDVTDPEVIKAIS